MSGQQAAQRGHDVTALVRDPARANLPEPVVKVRGDVLDPVSLGPAVEGRDLLDTLWKEVGDIAIAPHHPEGDADAELLTGGTLDLCSC